MYFPYSANSGISLLLLYYHEWWCKGKWSPGHWCNIGCNDFRPVSCLLPNLQVHQVIRAKVCVPKWEDVLCRNTSMNQPWLPSILINVYGFDPLHIFLPNLRISHVFIAKPPYISYFYCQTSVYLMLLLKSCVAFWFSVDYSYKRLCFRARVLSDRTLRIENVESSDQGTYVCTAENAAGSTQATAKLVVSCKHLYSREYFRVHAG